MLLYGTSCSVRFAAVLPTSLPFFLIFPAYFALIVGKPLGFALKLLYMTGN